MISRDDLVAVMGVLAAAFPTFNVTQDTMSVYHSALEDMHPEALKAAARAHIAESRFFPTVAELRAAGKRYSLETGVGYGMGYAQRIQRIEAERAARLEDGRRK